VYLVLRFFVLYEIRINKHIVMMNKDGSIVILLHVQHYKQFDVVK